MSSMELNKIVAAVLLAGVIAMTTGFLAELLVAPEELIENAYLVETGADEAGPTEEEEEQVPLAVLLANADPAEGESFVRACASCHTFDQGGADRIGPHLWGVVGRDKGGVEGFNYSSAMTEVEGEWSYEALDGFLHQPRDYLPGTSMSYAGIRDPEDRANVIAYMRTLSEDPLPLPEPPAEEAAAEDEGAAAGEGAGEQPAGEIAEEEAATAAPPAEPAGGEPAEAGEAGTAGEAAEAEEAADEADEAEADAAAAATEGGMAAEEAAADAEAAAETAEREAETLAETGGAAAQEAEDAEIDAEQAAGQAERAAGEAAPAQQPGEVATGTGEDEAQIRDEQTGEGTEQAPAPAAGPELLEEETGEALTEGAAGEAGELGPARGAPSDVDVDFVPVPEDAETEQVLEPAVPGSMGDEPGPVGETPAEEPEGPLEPPVTVQEGLVEEQEVEVEVDPDDVIAIEPGEPGEDMTEEVDPADRGSPE